jgi:hypothetical protein
MEHGPDRYCSGGVSEKEVMIRRPTMTVGTKVDERECIRWPSLRLGG